MILSADSEGPDRTADAQADLGLHCPHMSEDTYLFILLLLFYFIYFFAWRGPI